jgi:hypothetical protein
MSSIDSVAVDLGIIPLSLVVTAVLAFIGKEHIAFNRGVTHLPSALALLLFVA